MIETICIIAGLIIIALAFYQQGWAKTKTDEQNESLKLIEQHLREIKTYLAANKDGNE